MNDGVSYDVIESAPADYPCDGCGDKKFSPRWCVKGPSAGLPGDEREPDHGHLCRTCTVPYLDAESAYTRHMLRAGGLT